MRRFAILILGVICLTGVLGGMVYAAEWRFHDYQSIYPMGDKLTVYGTIDCVPVEPPLYEDSLSYCETATVCIPDWCNDIIAIFEWPKEEYGGCGNVDYHKVVVVDGDPGDWWFDPIGEWVDMLPPECIELPSIGDRTGVTQDVYIVVDLEEYLLFYPVPIMDEYWIDNGICPDLPGYLVSTTPIEFDPLGIEPFNITPYTGYLYWDGTITLCPGGASGAEPSDWSSIKALFR